jgi:tetratricopeptide (TPR) repeat protein
MARAEQNVPATIPALTPPPGLDAAMVTPLPSDQITPSTKLGRPLPQSLDEIEASWKSPTALPTPKVSDSDRADALAAYAQARLMLLNLDAAKAIPLLQSATRLDPVSTQPWRELGLANLSLNRRSAGVAALRKAFELGDDSPFVCYILGRESLRSAKPAEGLSLLTHAFKNNARADDPALPFLITAELGEALQSDGRLRAARDAFATALDLPESWGTESRLRTELAELYRRRFDLWLRVGDLSCQLADPAIAFEAYERASSTPTLDPGAVLPRRVFAAMRSGRPAQAATLVLESIERADGRFDDRHAELVAYLASTPSLAPVLAPALSDIRATLAHRLTPSMRARLDRIVAAAQPIATARGSLLESATRCPSDADAIAALIESFAGDSAVLAPALISLAESSPADVSNLASGLLCVGKSVDETVGALAARPGVAPRLVESAVLERTGRLNEAANRLDKVADSILVPELLAAWLSQRITIAAELADAATVDRLLPQLTALAAEQVSPARQIPLAIALLESRRFEEAAAAIKAIAPADVTPRAALLGAEASLRGGNAAGAEQFLQLALERDQTSEPAFEALAALYSTGGALASEQKLTELARKLRQSVPSGHLLRQLTARDMIARGAFRDAESILIDIARQSPADQRSVEALSHLVARAVATDAMLANRVGTFLRELAVNRPDSPALLIANSRALAANGKPDAALESITTRLSYWPMPELARVREQIIREVMNDAPRADDLARLRLEAAPRTFANAAELAEILARAGKLEDAARVLGEALSAGARLSPEQSKVILTLLGQLPQDPADEASARGTLSLFDQLEAQGITFTSPLILKRLKYAAFALEPAKVFELATAAGKAAPEIADKSFDMVIQYYAASTKHDRLLRFVEEVATRAEPWKADYTRVWLTAIGAWGTVDDARRLIASTNTPEKLKQFSDLFDSTLRLDTENDSPNRNRRAEIAYWLAGIMVNSSREEQAIPVYRLALELQPDYAIVANDLGYLLLERNESLDEAARLIEAAHAALSENANVIDSMGWLRYKQGFFTDTLDANGVVTREGAITLLSRAIRLEDDGIPNDAGLEHLGDAQWRAGLTTDALKTWRQSATAREGTIRFYQSLDGESARATELKASLAQLKAKIDAGAAGGQPAVAPIWPTTSTLKP